MKFISFENNGILEPDFIKSFGVSVKNDESCIGYFGTGLKYALAILLRNGAKVSIYSDNNVMRFGLKTKEIKGKDFQFITMNDECLPFTTELGKTWEPWMAYRELYSNAKDEGGTAKIIKAIPKAKDGRTCVIVAGGGIEELHENKDSVFVEKKNEIAPNIYPSGGSFFVKGVCVWKYENMPSVFSYNDSTGKCCLTEDRQIKYTFQVMRHITGLLARLHDKELISKAIMSDVGMFERDIDWDYCEAKPTQEFQEVVKENYNNIENKTLLRYYNKHLPDAPLQDFSLNDYQQGLVNQAIHDVRMAGFMVDEYPIRTVLNLRNNALGMAAGGTIYIAQDVFNRGGLEMLKATLIEEWVHLKFGYGDCERNMQNYLFEQLVRLIDLSNGIMKSKYESKAA